MSRTEGARRAKARDTCMIVFPASGESQIDFWPQDYRAETSATRTEM
jgi:hypothetical protein